MLSLVRKEQGVQKVLVYKRACGWSWAPRCFSLPEGKVPQCHCCPYSVAERGGPGGGAECNTVKRRGSACWHLPLPYCYGERKNLLFHMLVLVAILPSTHCPFNPLLHPPVSSRWLPEHRLPWVTVPDAVCVHRHPHSTQLVSSFLWCQLKLLQWSCNKFGRPVCTLCHSCFLFCTFFSLA